MLADDVPLGTAYEVRPILEALTLRCGGCGELLRLNCIFVYATQTSAAGFLPVGIFTIEGDQAIPTLLAWAGAGEAVAQHILLCSVCMSKGPCAKCDELWEVEMQLETKVIAMLPLLREMGIDVDKITQDAQHARNFQWMGVGKDVAGK
jgi:hypothetical protein